MDNKMTNQSVKKTLIMMALPTAIGMVSTFLFQLIDTYFIGLLGSEALAAVSFVYPVYLLIICILIGFSSAVASLVGQALGAKQVNNAKSVIWVALVTVFILAVGIGIIGTQFMDATFSLLGASGNPLHLLESYMTPIYLGLFLLALGLTANSALMAKGVVISTTVIMAAGGIINALLDYLLIFGISVFPELGIQGAAYATIISWASIAVMMLLLLSKHQLLSFNARYLREQWLSIQNKLIKLAIPIAATQLLVPIAVAVITAVIAKFGDNAVASLGIVFRIESLLLTGVMALGVVVTPIAAQYSGANRNTQLAEVIAFSSRLAIYWGIVCMAICWSFAESLMAVFTSKQAVIEVGVQYLQIISLSMPAIGFILVLGGIFNGLNQAGLSLKLSLLRVVALTIPLAIWGASFALEAVFLGIMTASVITAMYGKYLLDKWCFEHGLEPLTQALWLDYQNDGKHITW